MHICYGFNIEIEVPNPTTVITAFDVHPERRAEIVEEMGAIENSRSSNLKIHESQNQPARKS